MTNAERRLTVGALLARVDWEQRLLESHCRDLERLPRPLDGPQGARRVELLRQIQLLKDLYGHLAEGVLP